MDIESLREEIDKSIAEVKRLGWEIRPGMWALARDKCCCPLGAVVVDEFGPDATSRFYECDRLVPDILGIDREEMYSFADAFDSVPYDDRKHVLEFWQLGKEYARKYTKKYGKRSI